MRLVVLKGTGESLGDPEIYKNIKRISLVNSAGEHYFALMTEEPKTDMPVFSDRQGTFDEALKYLKGGGYSVVK